MAYTIGSEQGKKQAASMKAGESWTNPTDKSNWTKNADGSVTVTHQGVTTQNALPGAGGTANTNTNTNTNTTANKNTAPQVGRGGYAGGNFTGSMETSAKDANGNTIMANYVNGRLTNSTTPGDPDYLADGTVVKTNGGDYIYYNPEDKTKEVTNNKVSTVPTNYGKSTLDAWLSAAQEQATKSSDFAVQQAIDELTRAQQDAEEQFQTQRNQIDRDEALAKDNQALYAESRGDKGGIGAAQYDSIANTAAQNRLAVSQAQTKLSTDTARNIADLRAQGEFEKADALLELTQTYLSQLISLEQWAMEYNLSAAQFNASLDQWAQEYQLSVSNLTGVYNGQLTFEAEQYLNSRSQTAGQILLDAGIMPNATQLKAMDLTQEEAQSYIDAQTAASAKEAAITQITSSVNAGKMPSDALIQAAGYDKGTLQGIVDSVNDANNKSAAETQVSAMISIGEVPNEALVKAAGWDFDTVVSLATANKTANKTSPGGGPKSNYVINFEEMYNQKVTPSTVRSFLINNGVTEGLDDLVADYTDWLDEGVSDEAFARIQAGGRNMHNRGASAEEINAYVDGFTGLSYVQKQRLIDYFIRIGVYNTEE